MIITANESVGRGENGNFSRHDWGCAFPTGEDLYALRSVASFIEADETSVTMEAWTEKEHDIAHDVNIYQMKVRHLLVRKLVNEGSGTPVAGQVEEAETLATLNIDLETLEAEDKANKEQLAHPAAQIGRAHV